jgi:hypothetical protein
VQTWEPESLQNAQVKCCQWVVTLFCQRKKLFAAEPSREVGPEASRDGAGACEGGSAGARVNGAVSALDDTCPDIAGSDLGSDILRRQEAGLMTIDQANEVYAPWN